MILETVIFVQKRCSARIGATRSDSFPDYLEKSAVFGRFAALIPFSLLESVFVKVEFGVFGYENSVVGVTADSTAGVSQSLYVCGSGYRQDQLYR